MAMKTRTVFYFTPIGVVLSDVFITLQGKQDIKCEAICMGTEALNFIRTIYKRGKV